MAGSPRLPSKSVPIESRTDDIGRRHRYFVPRCMSILQSIRRWRIDHTTNSWAHGDLAHPLGFRNSRRRGPHIKNAPTRCDSDLGPRGQVRVSCQRGHLTLVLNVIVGACSPHVGQTAPTA